MKRLWAAVAAVVVVAGAVLVYLVTSGGTDEAPAAASPPTTTTSKPKPKPTLKPLGFAAQATWSIPDAVRGIEVRDGLVLVEDSEHLALLDAATGAQRWQLTAYEDLPAAGGVSWVEPLETSSRLVPYNGGLAVLTTYFWTDCPTDSCFDATGPRDEKGLMLLSVEDASVLWKARLQPSVDYSQPAPPRFELQMADDRIAVVTFEGGSTAAVSVGTGETIWTRPDVWPVAIAGDTLLAQAGDKPSPSPGWGDLEDGTVTAMDPATGAPRWDLADRSEVVLTGGDAVLVRVSDKDEVAGLLLALADGHELTTTDGEDVSGCATDGVLLACAGPDGVVVHDVATRAVTMTGVDAAAVKQVRDGRLFLRTTDRWSTIDAAGNVIDAQLPGELVAVTANQIFFRPYSNGQPTDVVSCYALT